MKIIKHYFPFFILLFCTFIFSLYFYESFQPKQVSNPQSEKQEFHMTLGMVGDALYHTGVYKDGLQKDGTYNFDSQLQDIAPIIQSYDLAYYNQETILGGTEIGLSTYPRFNSPQEVGDAFVNAGFNLVSLANNHTLDRGEQAILNSVAYWKSKNVMYSGSYDSFLLQSEPPIGEMNGITYAFFAYTDTTNGLTVPSGKEYFVSTFNKEKAKNDIEKVRDNVDIVIVSMHWGTEYTHVPTETQKEEANFLASLGVDIIIGSHPHVIQPIELIDNTVVFYSLGNFISGQDGINKRIGLLASLDIHKVVENDTTSITIDNIKGDLLYTYHNGSYRNFKVIPFSKLTNELLPNYEKIQVKYEAILKQNDSIQVGTLKFS